MPLLRKSHPLMLLLLALLPAVAFSADDDAIDWLERMIRSAHQLNYTGTFVYQQGGSLQSMKIIHAVSERGERERLVSLTGPSREVIRDRDRVTCYLPEDSSIVVEATAGTPRPFPLKLPEELGGIRQYYEIRLADEARIAGLSARKVVIEPRDNYRYGQNFWVATDTGLLLRAETVNEEGEVIEQLMYTSLEMHEAIPESELTPQFSANATVVQLEREPDTSRLPASQQQNWQVLELPPGFSQKLQRNHFLPHKLSPVEHHVYSDGLASVSVFVEQRGDNEYALNGASAMGGVNAYGRILDEHAVTVVGEVPPITVEQIARSLQPIQHD